MDQVFTDRAHAGRLLARALVARKLADPVILALPRAGVPVAPPESAVELQRQVDELVCLSQPEFFGAVGSFYADFHQASDEEVLAALARAAREARPEVTP